MILPFEKYLSHHCPDNPFSVMKSYSEVFQTIQGTSIPNYCIVKYEINTPGVQLGNEFDQELFELVQKHMKK